MLIKQKKNAIRELLVVSADESDCSFVQLKGKIKPNDISTLVKNVK